MARPEKFGHDYFSFYTRSDESSHEDLLAMISNNGYEGYVAVLELDCMIRGAAPDSNGYYIILDQRNSKKLSNVTKLSDKKLESIIEKALEIGHYDRDMYNKFGILTSRRIQEDHIITSTKRNNLLIRKDYMLLDKKDIRSLGIKKKMILVEDFWVWENSDEDIVNDAKNSENDIFIDGKNGVIDSKNGVSSEKNGVSSVNNTQIKINKRKINKKKENEIILNSESNSNGNCNCKDNEEGEPPVIIDHSNLHILLQSLLKKDLFPEDPTDIFLLNDFLFELQEDSSEGGYGYTLKDVMKAGRVITRTLKNKTQEELDDIDDPVEYITRAMLAEISKNKTTRDDSQEDIQDDIDDESDEERAKKIEKLERLKVERVMKKNKCTYEEALERMAENKEVRKNLKIGDDE